MRTSAGILLYRGSPGGTAGEEHGVEVWIAHMGGPFWASRDEHAWSIPKGEFAPPEDPLAAARREFEEEMGWPAPSAEYGLLGTFRQSSAKSVTVFTAAADFPDRAVRSNTFALELPPGSGTFRDFPEVDRAGWFTVPEARIKLVKGQAKVLEALLARLR
ncbi:NUDIX domain-containing protein [Arthrobacter gandavensis]|uniref:NUDIX domain-containing protein n=1 Tax=Arthrobacter gandavensis TaxID=169960 RepID=UPI00188F3EBD|nr:NUDIX domain-containing protein [Arthrobacter gandavensis]MBF4995017.1 NUDIX domain-containing protein [Arthrobacter gandavensis]